MDMEFIVEKLNAAMESAVDYETTHRDAGDNYAYMVAESWSSDDESRLADYMTEKGIEWAGLELDTLADSVLDQFEMESGHMWSAGNGGFLLTSFNVGEVEMQIDCADIGLEIVTRDICESLSRSSDVHCTMQDSSSILAYQSTDSIWDSVLSESKLRAIVKEALAELAQN